MVWDLQNVGGGVPDLICIWKGHCVPVEVKAPGREDNFTRAQEVAMAECAGQGVDWVIAVTVNDVLKALSRLRTRARAGAAVRTP